jgi:5-carboxymethyl-2-hydroxymuconate isomerase
MERLSVLKGGMIRLPALLYKRRRLHSLIAVRRAGMYRGGHTPTSGHLAMPHTVIEYSENLREEARAAGLAASVHRAVLGSGMFPPDAVKTRAYPASDFCLGTKGDRARFVHITVSLLAGRTQEQKQTLSAAVFAAASDAVGRLDALSVEIRDMDPETYRK